MIVHGLFKNSKLSKAFIMLSVIFFGVYVFAGCSEEVELKDIEEQNDHTPEETLNSEDLLNYLDKTALDILSLHGYPDGVGTYQGSVYWSISEKSISFFFHHHYYDKDLPFSVEETARVTAVSSSKIGAECYGAKLGMTFSEIESVMGFKGDKYWDYESDDIVLLYHLVEQKEGINDVELRFYAEDDKSPTRVLLIIWKGFEIE